MGLLDFLDSRRGVARWADKWFKAIKSQQTGASDHDIAQLSLAYRYRSFASDALRVYIAQRADSVHNIYDLCHLIADAENHNLLDAFEQLQLHISKDESHPVRQTYRIIDDELAKLGYGKAP